MLAAALLGASAGLLFSRPPGDGSAEAGFARDMMVHHAQAVQMAEIVRDKTKSDDMRLLASDIALTQQAQIGIMQGWLGVWGLSIVGTEPAMAWMGHPMDGPMPGMATPEEINRLGELPPEEADALFLRLMIPHHQAAIPMADAILKRTDRPEVRHRPRYWHLAAERDPDDAGDAEGHGRSPGKREPVDEDGHGLGPSLASWRSYSSGWSASERSEP